MTPTPPRATERVRHSFQPALYYLCGSINLWQEGLFSAGISSWAGLTCFFSCAGLAQDERLAVQQPRRVIPVIYSDSDTHCFAEIDRVCICVLVRRPDALSGDLGAVLRRWDILFLPQLGSLVHRIPVVKWARDVNALMGTSPLSLFAYQLWRLFHVLAIRAPLALMWVSAGYNLVIKTPLHKRAVTWLTPASFTALLLRGIGTGPRVVSFLMGEVPL